MRRTLALAAVLAWTAGTGFAAVPTQDNTWIPREVGFDQHLGQDVPLDLAFRDEAGQPVKLGDFFGRRPVVLALVYYECPMLCTLTLNALASALGVLSFDVGKEFEVVVVSFDPKEDAELAAAKKKAYLARYKRAGAEQGWHFLTGEAGAILRLTKAVGFRYAWDPETKQFAHPAGILVLTPRGTISRYLYGIEYAPRDLRLALVESAQGKIGSPVDQAVLYCYRYDPKTGRYSMAIMNLIRLGGALTLAALLGFVTLALRRERAATTREGRAG